MGTVRLATALAVAVALVYVPMSFGYPVIDYSDDTFDLANFKKVDVDACANKMDLGFLIHSELSEHYSGMLRLVMDIAGNIDISKEGIHGGVAIFSDKAQLAIRMNRHLDTQSFIRWVRKIPSQSPQSRMDLGFKLVSTKLFNKDEGARPNIPKVLVLITDDKQNPKLDTANGDTFDPVASSKDLYDEDVSIFAVGVGTKVDKDELTKITRSDKRVKIVDDSPALKDKTWLENLVSAVCEAGKKAAVGTTPEPSKDKTAASSPKPKLTTPKPKLTTPKQKITTPIVIKQSTTEEPMTDAPCTTETTTTSPCFSTPSTCTCGGVHPCPCMQQPTAPPQCPCAGFDMCSC